MGKNNVESVELLCVMDLLMDNPDGILRVAQENLFRVNIGMPYQYPIKLLPVEIIAYRPDMEICRIVAANERDLDLMTEDLFGKNFAGGRKYRINPSQLEEDDYRKEFYSRMSRC